MSTRNKKRLTARFIVLMIFLLLADLALLIRRLLHGKNVALFNPRGLIAHEQHTLMLYTAVVLLTIGVPSVFLLYFTAWKYRESNSKADYEPDKHHGVWFNLGLWALPASFMLLLASVMWPSTHQLAPQKSVDSSIKPLTIQVVSMRWKWLFIYPDQNIASVNFVEIPVNTPVQFELTADEAPMSSFWIPNLGGQLYTMTGMVNHLNLMADTMGDYSGSSAELNGAGFAGMKFTARATNSQGFDKWVQAVKQTPAALDSTKYANILKPSENYPIEFYSSYFANLYDNVINKYMGPVGSHTHH